MPRPDFPDVIDNTIVSAFRKCPQYAFRTYIQHYKPTTLSVHLHAGKAFATGLETTRRAFYEQGLDSETAIQRGIQTLLTEYGDFACPDDSAKSAVRLSEALVYYFDVWPLATDQAKPLVLPSGKRAIEFSFADPLPVMHPVTGQPLIYTGRSDMVAESPQGIFIEDDKTTTQLGASWSNQWDLRSQFTGYCWGAQQAKIPVDGVLVRGVAILKTKFNQDQYLTYRAQWEIDRWLEQTCRDLRRMIERWEEGYWDYNLADACGDFGGCSLRQVCKAANPDEWLGVYFQRRHWDPLNRVEHVLGDI